MKNKKKLIPILIFSAILAVSGTTAFAYYVYHKNADVNVSLISDETEVVSVGSFDDLFFASKASNYNDSSSLSYVSDGTATRRTISFTSDISLAADLSITADCHINLSGYDLIMNGHSLTVSNTYAGDFLFAGGSRTEDDSTKTGRVVLSDTETLLEKEIIYLSTPNAVVCFDGVEYGSYSGENGSWSALASCEEHQQIVSTNFKYLAYNAFYMVATAIADEGNYVKDKLSFKNMPASVSSLTAEDFIFPRKNGSDDNTEDTLVPFSYVLSDLDLPFTYGGYNSVVISYESSDPSIVSDKGNLLGTSVVSLTVYVSYEDNIASCEFYLHADNDLSDEDKKNIATTFVSDVLNRNYVEKDALGQDFNQYVFNRDAYFPISFPSLSDVSIEYTAYNYNGTSYTQVFPKTGEEILTEGNTILFTPTMSTNRLSAKITVGEEVSEPPCLTLLPMTSSNTSLVINAATIANDLITDWYGSKIGIVANYSGDSFQSHTSQELYTTLRKEDAVYTSYFVSVSYSLSNDVEEMYQISDKTDVLKILQVKSGKHPENDAQKVLLYAAMIIRYNGKEQTINIQLPVECVKSTGESDQLELFLPYYNLYSRTFLNATNSSTLDSFRMPFAYGASVPMMIYDFVAESENILYAKAAISALGLNLIYNGESYLVKKAGLEDPTLYKNMVIGYLAALNDEMTEEEKENLNHAQWHILPNGSTTFSAYAISNWETTESVSLPIQSSGQEYYSAPLYVSNKGETASYFYYCPGATISLYYSEKEHVLSPLYSTAFTFGENGDSLTAYKITEGVVSDTSISLSVLDLIAAGNTMWEISIEKNSVAIVDTVVKLLYEFKMEVLAQTWSIYHSFNSFTLPGVLTSADVPDANFYEWIYNNFNTTGDKTFEEGEVIRRGWLTQNVALNIITDTNLKNIQDFTGLKYLIGTQYLDLSGISAQISQSVIPELQYMTSLVSLHLENANISFNAAADYTSLKGLQNLSYLTSLYLNGNSIYLFDWLDFVASLSEVYIYSTAITGDDAVFYGGEGLVNMGIFHDLLDRGINVYNTASNGSPNLFSDSLAASPVYLALIGVEYQQNLPENADIRNLYSSFSTSYSDYGITTAIASTYTARSIYMEWGYLGTDPLTATVFTLTFTVDDYTTVIKYRITRISE